MEKQAKIRHLPFLNSFARAQKRYGLDMSKDDFVEEAYNVWREIGNQAPVLNRFFTKVPEDFIIELPPDCEFIEGVIIINEPQIYRTADSQGVKEYNKPATYVEAATPHLNQSLNTSYNGKSVNYELAGKDAIHITSPDALYRDLMVVYKSILVDEDGLPLLNDKEVAAIAAEVTRRDVMRKAFSGIQGMPQALQFITQEADRLMAAAKVDEYINDDALDKMLDAKVTFDRKVYGRRINLQG